jgi:hypothetical protein
MSKSKDFLRLVEQGFPGYDLGPSYPVKIADNKCKGLKSKKPKKVSSKKI